MSGAARVVSWALVGVLTAVVALVWPPAGAHAAATVTVVVLPDTQIATQNHPEYFTAQTRWIADNHGAARSAFVVHVGDVVESPRRVSDWERARNAMSVLDGRVPYAVAVGNHDMDAWSRGGYAAIAADRSTAAFNRYFPPASFAGMGTLAGTYPPGASDNTYHRFTAGAVDWLVLSLIYRPTDAELSWAAGVVAANPRATVIVNTHDYLDGTARSEAGQRIWSAVAGRFPNVLMVLSGHYVNRGYRADAGVRGNVVHQVMANFQTYHEPDAAENSFLRVMRFDPRAATVRVRTYSPYFDRWKTDPANSYTISGVRMRR